MRPVISCRLCRSAMPIRQVLSLGLATMAAAAALGCDQEVRESATRVEGSNNTKQVGLAVAKSEHAGSAITDGASVTTRRNASVVTQKPGGTATPPIRKSSPSCAPLPPARASCARSMSCKLRTYRLIVFASGGTRFSRARGECAARSPTVPLCAAPRAAVSCRRMALGAAGASPLGTARRRAPHFGLFLR